MENDYGSLGKLLVEIGADLGDLDKGFSDANKKIDSFVQKTNKSITAISKSMITLGGAIMAAFGFAVNASVRYGDEIYEASQRTGVATETLSELKYVAEQTESSFEALQMGLRLLSRNIFEAANGNDKLKNTFDLLGVTVQNADGTLRSVDNILLQVADKFTQIKDDTQKSALAIEIFGRSGQSLVPILNLGSKGIEELSAKARSLGLTLSTDNAKAIDKFSDDLKTVKAALGGLWLEISNNVLPALNKFTLDVTKVVIKVREWSEEHPVLSSNIANTVLKFGALVLLIGTFNLTIIKTIETLRSLAITLGAIQVLSTFRLAGLVTDIGILTVNVGIMYPIVVLIGTALAAWNIGKLIGQIPAVERFFDKMMGVNKAKESLSLEEELNRKAVEKKQSLYPTTPAPAPTPALETQMTVAGTGAGEGEFNYFDAQAQQYKDFIDKVKMMSDEELSNLQNSLTQKVSMTKSLEDQRTKIIEQEVEKRKALEQANTDVAIESMGLLSEVVSAFGENSKAAFFVLKAISLAEIIINGMVAAAGISAKWAWNPPVEASLLAKNTMLTMLRVATVAATTIAGLATGTDTVPAMLSPGEMVIPSSFSDAIREGRLSLSSPEFPTQTQAQGDVIIENINIKVDGDLDQSALPSIMDQIGLAIETNLRGAV
jgi:hypothetical protein